MFLESGARPGKEPVVEPRIENPRSQGDMARRAGGARIESSEGGVNSGALRQGIAHGGHQNRSFRMRSTPRACRSDATHHGEATGTDLHPCRWRRPQGFRAQVGNLARPVTAEGRQHARVLLDRSPLQPARTGTVATRHPYGPSSRRSIPIPVPRHDVPLRRNRQVKESALPSCPVQRPTEHPP